MNNRQTSAVDAAHELIAELHRSPNMIPPYNAMLLKQSSDSIHELFEKNREIVENLQGSQLRDADQSIRGIVASRQHTMNRILRCCYTYIEERKNRLKTLRWKMGGVLSEEIKQNLSADELNWFKAYSRMIASYQIGFGNNGINLMLHTSPPKSLSLQVRVIQDYGECETSDGNTVLLKKNSIHFLPSIDVQSLLKRGILELAETASANL